MSLVLRGVQVAIGRRRVVDGVSAELPPGRTLALLGRNGAGKTTLLRGLAGLLPVGGQVLLDGQDLPAMAPRARSRLTGYVAQDLAAVSARLTVLELLLLAQNSASLSWRAAPDSLARGVETLDMLGLGRFADSVPAELSGGERQMVLLALALVRRPRLLLLDEPTSALDLANQLYMLAVVREYTRREGIMTAMILHDLSLAARFADLALMLEGGRPDCIGPVGDVLTEEVIARVYGVTCRVTVLDGTEYRAVHPLAVIGDAGRVGTAP